MNTVRRLFALLLCAALLSTCVFAGEINPNKTCSLTVRCKHKTENVTFAIWRVAKVSADVRFTKIDDFKSAKVNVNDTDDWDDMAETLMGFVESHGIQPLATADTNSKGEAAFKKLKSGLYLVVGEPYTYEGKTYEQDPFLIALPTRSQNTDPWEYDVTTIRKPAERVEYPDEKITIRVLKIWSGDDDTLVRPASITVHLLRDGAIYDSVTLNRRNNWDYQWTDLPAGHTWRVAEVEVPDAYSVLVRRNGYDFVIINTYEEPQDPQPPTTPTGPDDIVDIPDDNIPLDKPEELPETGTLKWVVPLLLGAGAVLFLLGLLRRRQEG